MRTAAFFLCAILTVCPCNSEGHTFTGRVERVIDGDTICARAEGAGLKAEDRDRWGLVHVRLAEIDAPELKETGGQESKQALAGMILNKTVWVEWKHRGRYRRIICQVYLDGEWINLAMVAQGWARHFQRYSRTPVLLRAQETACEAKLGIWRE